MQFDGMFAVVTGASMGLGRSFALELATRGMNTVLVALPGEQLEEVCRLCRAFGVESVGFETDLSERARVLEFAEWVNARYEIFMLINNAGTGGTQAFHEAKLADIQRILDVNISAMALLTHQLMPNLMRQKTAFVLNVSSMASFSPIGFKTVYPASKRFVHHFSRGLYQELRGTSVFVSVVHPGPMATNPDVTARIKKQGWLGRLGLMSPERVARLSIRQLLRRDTLILLGWSNKFNWLLMVLLPIWIKLPLLTWAIRRELPNTKTANL